MVRKISLGKMALVLSLLMSLLIVPSLWSQDDDPQQPQSVQMSFAPDRILVKFHSFAPENIKDFIHQSHGGQVLDVIPEIDVHVVQISKNKIKDMLRAYRKQGWVEYVEPDYIAHAMFTPNDPSFGNQWGMTKIQAPEAWNITQGASTVKIAICDTGIDQNHEDLAGKIVANKNFTWNLSVDDKYGHGTHVAGIAAAVTNNGKGVAGVGFNSSLMNVKVLGDNGSGYTSWIANGIIWAANNGAKVINLSLGSSSPSSTLENAVNTAWNKGAVVVAAAGNSGNSARLYPAAYANCIAVAATDQNDNKATFSNYGFDWVDVAAPGVSVFSTLPNHSNRIGIKNYGSLSGTSMATPHVSGVAALVWATSYGTSNQAVRDRIETTAECVGLVGNICSGYQIERVNASRAVSP